MTIADWMVPEYDAEMESTRGILACVPDGKRDWKPHAKSMALGSLAVHVAETGTWWITETMTKETFAPPPDFKPWIPATTAELLEKFDAMRAEARASLVNASDADYMVNWTMLWGGQKIVDDARVRVVRKWGLNHLIHHRGQLGVYLRLLDIEFPGMYGPSATDMEKMDRKS